MTSLIPRGRSSAGGQIHLLEILGNAILGGMERQVANLITHLPAGRFRVTCLCPFESVFTQELRQMGCEVFVAPVRDDPAWRSIQAAVELVQLKKIDVIHAHMARAHVLAGLAGRLTETPVVATIHGKDVSAQEIGITRTAGSHLITVCQEAFSQALALGVPAERVSLIRNGVDLDRFTPDEIGDEFRRSLGVDSEIPLVGFVSRLDPEKGPDQFLWVAEEIVARREDVHLAIVGEGVMHGELATAIERKGLGNRIHLAGAWSNVNQVYPALDVVVQTSRSDGTPLVLLEAMACGRPVVAMETGGIAEVIEVGTTGVLVGAGDWLAAARAALDLLDQPEKRRSMGLAARERAVGLFDARTTARLTADLFEQMRIERRSSVRGEL